MLVVTIAVAPQGDKGNQTEIAEIEIWCNPANATETTADYTVCLQEWKDGSPLQVEYGTVYGHVRTSGALELVRKALEALGR